MGNESVTDVAAWQEALRNEAERTRGVVSAPAARGPKCPLEDVEKFVSEHGPFVWYYSDLLGRMLSVSQCRCGCGVEPADQMTENHYAKDGGVSWLDSPAMM